MQTGSPLPDMPKAPKSSHFLRDLGERISECERSASPMVPGYSVAAELGVSDGAMSRYRLGRNEPSIVTLKKLARLCAVNFEWLALGEGERDRPTNCEIALDVRAYERVDRLDSKGAPDGDWGYIARNRFTNLPSLIDVPVDRARHSRLYLGCFQITERFQEQKYAAGTWVLVDRSKTVPAAGWLCMKGPGDEAYVREVDIDDDGMIDVMWPRTTRPAEVKKFNHATFIARFAVIGRVVGAMSVL